MTSTDGFWYDGIAAEAAVRWFPRYLTHPEGPLSGKPFVLAEWQCEKVIRPLYGWKRGHDHPAEDSCDPSRCRFGRRRYRRLYMEVPRGNGKSALAAGLGLKGLQGDREPNPQIIGAATDRNSANIIFGYAARMVRKSARLAERLRVLDATKRIIGKQSDRLYHVLSADAPRAHGYHPTRIIFDELHAQPNRDLYDVLSTSQVTLDNPLLAMFTTAGFDKKSICGELHDHALRVLDDPAYDEEFLPIIYAASPDDDFADEAVWEKANPNLGISVDRSALRMKVQEAQASPSYLNTVLRLHFDIWTAQESRWMPMDEWDQCGGIVVEADLKGRICYGGLDLSSTTDLTALALVFPPENGDPDDTGVYDVLLRFWVPQEGIQRRANIDHVPYADWEREGFIDAIPGAAVDTRVVREDILKLSKQFRIKELAFDRWGATQIAGELDEEGINVIPFGQGYRDLTAPTKDLLRFVLSHRIRHGGNPVLRWNADNLVVTQDPAGNIKPAKDKSTEKIDGAVALIMALGRSIANRQSGVGPSVRFIA